MKISIDKNSLFDIALEEAKLAYCPYSNFRVGAALLLESGEVIKGVNVENRSYGLTNCAERTAIFAAIAMGHRCFKAIAIATPDSCFPVPPCGACRQVISEFMQKDALVYFGSCKENIKTITVEQLYPFDSLHELREK